jgi:hypothetical protein
LFIIENAKVYQANNSLSALGTFGNVFAFYSLLFHVIVAKQSFWALLGVIGNFWAELGNLLLGKVRAPYYILYYGISVGTL